jgi:hypothetical protein
MVRSRSGEKLRLERGIAHLSLHHQVVGKRSGTLGRCSLTDDQRVARGDTGV